MNLVRYSGIVSPLVAGPHESPSGAGASGGDALIDVPPWPAELELLEAEELRLLAEAIGDHLPVELAERVEALRQRRRALELVWREPA